MTDESESTCACCGTELNGTVGGNNLKRLCPVCIRLARSPFDESLSEETLIPTETESEAEVSYSEKTASLALGESFDDFLSPDAVERSFPKNVGRFQVRQVLGSGSFGTVYRAYDPFLDREVALKVPRFNSDDPRQFDRFMREAKAAARLRHPNIVAVFECGVAAGEPFIASEFVDGTPLSETVKQGDIDIRSVVDWVRQIAEAIHYAHSEGIVHRDLKPANIMMSKSGRPQVMDFGLAKLTTDSEMSLSAEGGIVGTPAFMAPEQARGDKSAVGPKSDQYSVGVVLYVLLCGRRPWIGDAWSIISRVADPVALPETPRSISRNIPRDLEACCLKAMEKDQKKRYDNLNDMAEDLAHWLEGRPLLARPVGLRERLVRWCARNRMIASLLGVITALILTATVVGFLLAFQFSNLANAEKTAKREVERVLIDTFTESGLEAGRNGRDQEAELWFGSAVALATEHPLREQMNRCRFQTWLNRTPTPVRMFEGLGTGHKSLSVHPSGQFVLSEQGSSIVDQCQIWNLSSGDLLKLPGGTAVSAAAWSFDGTMLALSSGTEVRIYRFPQLEQVDHWSSEQWVSQLLFTKDGHRIAVGCSHSVIIHELSEQRSSRAIPTPGSVLRIAWNDSNTALATLCNDQKVYVWNADPAANNTEPMMPALSCPIESEAPPLQFLNDTRLIVPESHKGVTCWDVSTGTAVWTYPCRGGDGFAVSPDMSRVAILDRETLIQVDAGTGETTGEPVVHPNLIYSVAYDLTGQRLLTGCADQFARIYSVASVQLLATMRHGDIVHRVAWFPDGNACVTVHWKADLVRVWQLGASSQTGFIQDLSGSVMHVKWSDDGQQFLPAGMDQQRFAGAGQVLNTRDGKPVDLPVSFPGRVSDGCFVPQSRGLIMAGSAAADETGEDAQKVYLQKKDGPGLIVCFSRDAGTSQLWTIETKTNVVAVESSPDGQIVAALCFDHELLIIDPKTGIVRERHQAFPGKACFMGFVIYRRLAFSPTGDRFAVWGSQSRTVEMRSAVDGHLLFTVAHTNESNVDWLHDVVFSPDGKTIATCSADQTTQLWDANTGASRQTPLRHTGWVFSARFSQDGRRLLTACQDRQARLWNINAPHAPVMVTPTQSDEVYATCFLPGDTAFLIGLRSGEVSAWDTEQGKMIAPSLMGSQNDPVYTIELSPDQSRVIIVSRDKHVRGFPPSQWQPLIDKELSAVEVQILGEVIASEELHNGVPMGLAPDDVFQRWKQLKAAHSRHSFFQWPKTSDFTAANPEARLSE